MMGYDPEVREVVLFGGQTSGGTELGDTWIYRDGGWTNVTSNLSVSPSPRWNGGMTWDDRLGVLVLFGGRNSTIWMNDTWEFQGSGWTRVPASVAPPPMTAPEFGYDASDGYAILFGGLDLGTLHMYNATWTFDGTGWTNITSQVLNNPPPASFTFGTYDASDGYMVYFGGGGWSGGSVNCVGEGNTWTYHNRTWQNLTASLPVRPDEMLGSQMMAYDPLENGVLLTGGYASGCVATNETWVFSQGRWFNLTSNITLGPMPRWDARLAYDAYDYSDVLFSGNANPIGGSNRFATDTWNYSVSHRPLSVVASATPSRGAAPLSVDLHSNASGGEPTYAYSWSFGDGSPSSNLSDPVHVFTAAGTYTARIILTDGSGHSSNGSVVLSIYPPFVPSILASPSSGLAPANVSFSASASGGFPPYSFAWNLGAGGPIVNGTTVSITYTNAGSYGVTLFATDGAGDHANRSTLFQVAGALGVTAVARPTEGETPFTTTFAATGTGGFPPYGFFWQFGVGGATGGGASTSFTYSAAGDFTVNVTMTDANGNTAATSITVHVVPALSVAVTAAPPRPSQGTVVILTASVAGGAGPYSFSWTGLPPGCASTNASVVPCQPSGTGTFSVTVEVTDALGDHARNSATLSVESPGLAFPALFGSPIWFGVLLALVAVLIVAGLMVLRRRRRRGSPSSPAGSLPAPPPAPPPGAPR